MSYITDSELDALFTDVVNMDIDVGGEMPVELESIAYPLTAFYPFARLPAELRNEIYVHYMDEFYNTNPLRINASGCVLRPPLIDTCRGMHHETHGYITPYLHQKVATGSLYIEAQILSYNPTPLHATLASLSAEFSIPEAYLRSWTTVTFIGTFNYSNIKSWLYGSAPDNPIFAERRLELGDLPAFVDAGMFTGRVGLLYPADQIMYLEQTEPNRLRYLAAEFLDMAGELGFMGARRRGVEVVVEVIARWHHGMRGDFAQAKKKRMTAKELRQLRTKHAEMANAVYAFWTRCAVV